ncbi:Uncharacterized protein TCM_046248 [Theobroma cacao]|uniref:RNase H type-1 domain-containing protein n=1 Tax=Theobroma cacao TaxID=3641 RepID=S1SI86_THECC|nr:Uncharacterized protein TCM_046248 [Theobroma cacao]
MENGKERRVHPRPNVRTKKLVVWSKLEEGWLKFNMDGASRGNPGEIGIGGILKDHRGTTLILISKFMVELMVVKEAIIALCASVWSNSSLEIE